MLTISREWPARRGTQEGFAGDALGFLILFPNCIAAHRSFFLLEGVESPPSG